MPNGAAANLASGGMPPVATASRKAVRHCSTRARQRRQSFGSSSLKAMFSANGGGKLHLIDQPIRAVVARRRSFAGNAFLAGLEANRRRQLRGTGALNDKRSGRIGRQAA